MPSVPTTGGNFAVTVTTTSTTLNADENLKVRDSVVIKADAANTDTIHVAVGQAATDANGFTLTAGQSVTIVNQLFNIFVKSDANSPTARVIWS